MDLANKLDDFNEQLGSMIELTRTAQYQSNGGIKKSAIQNASKDDIVNKNVAQFNQDKVEDKVEEKPVVNGNVMLIVDNQRRSKESNEKDDSLYLNEVCLNVNGNGEKDLD